PRVHIGNYIRRASRLNEHAEFAENRRGADSRQGDVLQSDQQPRTDLSGNHEVSGIARRAFFDDQFARYRFMQFAEMQKLLNVIIRQSREERDLPQLFGPYCSQSRDVSRVGNAAEMLAQLRDIFGTPPISGRVSAIGMNPCVRQYPSLLHPTNQRRKIDWTIYHVVDSPELIRLS